MIGQWPVFVVEGVMEVVIVGGLADGWQGRLEVPVLASRGGVIVFAFRRPIETYRALEGMFKREPQNRKERRRLLSAEIVLFAECEIVQAKVCQDGGPRVVGVMVEL